MGRVDALLIDKENKVYEEAHRALVEGAVAVIISHPNPEIQKRHTIYFSNEIFSLFSREDIISRLRGSVDVRKPVGPEVIFVSPYSGIFHISQYPCFVVKHRVAVDPEITRGDIERIIGS